MALVVLSEAIGRLALGLTLLAAFSLGMAAVLVVVGAAAEPVPGLVRSVRGVKAVWERRLGIVGGLILAAIGLSLLR